MKRIIIFTDLDGTILNESYAFDSALPALALIEQNKIPLIICSSKTRPEIEFYRERLNNNHPFISENGGGIFIPVGYFGQNVIIPEHHRTAENNYDVITLGAHYADLRKTFRTLQEEGFSVKGFGDMSAEEISHAMGLTIEEATMAKQRDFDEPFFYTGREEKMEGLFSSISDKGLHVTKGRIYHLLGQSDKGKAASILIDLYKQKHRAISSVGIGDSLNDRGMLEAVDVPIIVQRPDGTYDSSLMAIPKVIRAKGIGPKGWNRVLTELVPHLRSKI